MKRDFYYNSTDGKTKIHGVEWKTRKKPVAVLQMIHGMAEHIGRYDELAAYLAERGICVVGHDHLGHGGSVRSKEHYGFFEEKEGNRCVIGDIHRLRRLIQKKYPGVPFFMLGHSMGSFLLRQYLMYRPEGICGVLILGTGYHTAPELMVGQILCKIIAQIKGWNYRSRVIHHLGVGHYNNSFKPSAGENDWVTSDENERIAYEADPGCGFTFTVNAYYHMFRGIRCLTSKNWAERIPRKLPVLILSGTKDPVGNFGKGVKKVYRKYRNAGFKKVRLHLYEDARHELLHEKCKEKVEEEIYRFIIQNKF